MFGDPDSLIQIDMSEYMEKFTASRLIGSPPGYVGYEEGGQLSEAVRRRPYSVVLFDEVEKAHPDVMNLLLQILEDGTVTDSLGRKIDFRNTIIIMTSNVGASTIKRQTSLGFGAMNADESDFEGMKAKILEESKRYFKPEFLNRLDDLVVFHMLEKADLNQIVDLEVSKLVKRLKEKEIVMTLSPEARDLLAEKGFDPAYGARPMRRAVERFLEDPLAEALLRCLETGEPVRSRVVLPQQTSPLGDLETRGNNAWIIDAAQLSDTPDRNPNTRVVIRDVTPEYQLDQIRKDFVANASHELRTPLAIINGYLENLLDEGMIEDTEMAKRFLTVMKKHTERISRIVEDMLVISRLESGEASAIKIEPFKLRPCVKDVLERLESVVRSQKAEVAMHLHDDDVTLEGDRFYWTQVLFNLVENALKQNPYKDLKVEVGSSESGGNILIWVKDNGIGIDPIYHEKIFQFFKRFI
jgi:signal transduction histidine kinase